MIIQHQSIVWFGALTDPFLVCSHAFVANCIVYSSQLLVLETWESGSYTGAKNVIRNDNGLIVTGDTCPYFRCCILQAHCSHILISWRWWSTKPPRGLCHQLIPLISVFFSSPLILCAFNVLKCLFSPFFFFFGSFLFPYKYSCGSFC